MISNRFLAIFLSVFSTWALSANTNISLFKKTSKQWDFVLKVANCNDDELSPSCEGAGTLDIFNKGRDDLFQRITIKKIGIQLDTTNKTTVNTVTIDDKDNSTLVIDDFNFDNHDDIALLNGYDGGYGSPSYNIYLFDVDQKQFLFSKTLTVLASEGMGLFDVDKKKRTLTTFMKSGASWSQESTYKVVHNTPMLISDVTKEYLFNENMLEITIRNLVEGQWEISKKKSKFTQ